MAPYRPTKGELLELRLARLLFAEGAFVRRSVDLRAEFGSEFTVTDLDVLSLRIGSDLSVRRTIGECKSGMSRTAAKASDRLLWGRGLRELMGADSHLVMTTRKIDADVRALAQRLGAEVLDERDLHRREQLLRLNDSTPYGSHDPELLPVIRDLQAALRHEDALKRASRFALSDGWLMEPIPAVKRSLGACQLLSRHFARDTTAIESRAIEWLLWQCLLVFCVNLVHLAGAAYRRPPELFEPWFMEQLAGGVVPAHEMERISRDVDEYIVALLAKLGASPAQQVDALGALAPEPPHYAEPLLELVRRLAAEPGATAEMPRTLDWRIAEFTLERSLGTDPAAEGTSRLLRTVAAFLRGPVHASAGLLRPLTDAFQPQAAFAAASHDASAPTQPSDARNQEPETQPAIAKITEDPQTREPPEPRTRSKRQKRDAPTSSKVAKEDARLFADPGG